MEIRDIYLCMYSYLFTCMSTNNLNSTQQTALFTRVESPQTNAVDSSIAHTPWKKLKRRREWERESNIISWNTKTRSKVGGKNNLKL